MRNASRKACGRLSATSSSALTGPCGSRRPCSQLRKVPMLTPMKAAKASWGDPCGSECARHRWSVVASRRWSSAWSHRASRRRSPVDNPQTAGFPGPGLDQRSLRMPPLPALNAHDQGNCDAQYLLGKSGTISNRVACAARNGLGAAAHSHASHPCSTLSSAGQKKRCSTR
jgi:hypothetical protein